MMLQRFSLLRRPNLMVLMYHRVSGDGSGDALTITDTDLETQLLYLQQQGYTPILLSNLVKHIQVGAPLPAQPVLITFDDGYKDNYTHLYPLLKKLGMRANIFLVPSFIEQEPGDEVVNHPYLSLSDIQSMDSSYVEFGLHSYDHKNYKKLSPPELDQDITLTKALLITMGVPFQPCLAFPYGAYPKRNPFKQHRFFEILAQNGIVLAFRIGNRFNPLPLRQPLLIQRFDIRGDASFEQFARIIHKAKAVNHTGIRNTQLAD